MIPPPMNYLLAPRPGRRRSSPLRRCSGVRRHLFEPTWLRLCDGGAQGDGSARQTGRATDGVPTEGRSQLACGLEPRLSVIHAPGEYEVGRTQPGNDSHRPVLEPLDEEVIEHLPQAC